jgi:hypothetical protein
MGRSVRRQRQPHRAQAAAASMPGFTAEASLVTSEQRYVTAVTALVRSGRALPQLFFAPGAVGNCVRVCGGDPDCIQCCLCVHRGGHPWYCCM